MNTSLAISTLRRDLTLGRVLHKLTLALAVGLFAYSLLCTVPWARLAAFGLVLLWIGLTVWSLWAGRITAQAARLIAAGRHEEAEDSVQQAVRRFGVLRPIKLATLHQLAVLRHAQGRWAEAVAAGAAFLRQSGPSPMQNAAELLVTEAALEVDDLVTAHHAIVALRNKPLGIDHFAALLLLQLDYQSRLELWPAMAHNVQAKLDLLDLRPAPEAALGCALIALAKSKLGESDEAAALSERAILLEEASQMVDRRSVLRDILQPTTPTSGNQDDGETTVR